MSRTSSYRLLIPLLFAFVIAVTGVASSSSQTPLNGYSIVILSPFPKLPSDGRTYSVYALLVDPAGKLAEFPPNMTIEVSVDDPTILQPVKTVIRTRESSEIIEIQVVPKSSGTAVLTVGAPGTGAADATSSIDVVEPAGKPYRIAMSAEPGSVLFGERAMFRVGVEDYYGNLVQRSGNTSISLTSYPSGIVAHPKVIIHKGGRLYSYANATAGNVTCTCTLIGTSDDLEQSGPTILHVSRVLPRIVVTLMPDNMIADSRSKVMVLVQMEDEFGRPLMAESPATVYVSSSNTTVLQVLTPKLTIEPGSDHAVGEAILGCANGVATITAHASGFLSGSTDFESTTPGQVIGEGGPVALKIYAPPVVAVGQEYPVVIAEVTGAGHVYKPDFGYNVTLTSSNPGVLEVEAMNSTVYYGLAYASNVIVGAGTCEAGENLAILTATPITTNFGVLPASLEISTMRPGRYGGGRPVALKISGPALVLNDEKTYYSIVLVDDAGDPAPAPRDVYIDVFHHSITGNLTVRINPETLKVKEGSSHGFLCLTTHGRGDLVIYAAAEGYSPGRLVISSAGGVGPPSAVLRASIIPPELRAGSGNPAILYVYLTDMEGNPFIVSKPVKISMTSSSPLYRVSSTRVTIWPGSFYSKLYLPVPPHAYNISMLLSLDGTVYTLPLKVVELPMELNVSGLQGTMAPGRSYEMRVSVSSMGVPVAGAHIHVDSARGTVKPRLAIANGDGVAVFRYTPPESGKDIMVISAERTGYIMTRKEYTISTSPPKAQLTIKALSSTFKKPIKGLDIAILSSTGKQVAKVKTDSNGVASAILPIGTYIMRLPREAVPVKGMRAVFVGVPGISNKPELHVRLTRSTTLTSLYEVFYRIAASSPYGKVTGAGEYPEGTKIKVGVEPTVTNEFPIRHAFKGWTGSISSEKPTVTVVMSRPITLTAVWIEDYTILYVSTGIIVIAAAIVVFLVVNRLRGRRIAEAEAEAEEAMEEGEEFEE